MALDLKLFNSLTKQKESFVPIKKGVASVYTCGPTVYDRAHLGNFRSYIFADILIRALNYNGFATRHIINITDVGHLTDDADQGVDKLENRAKKENSTARQISALYTDLFLKDFKKLNLTQPDKMPRATDHINEQIKMIGEIEKKGFSYKTKDGVYFDTSKLKDYGKLIGLNPDSLLEGARVKKNIEKKNLTDFALWKFSSKNESRQMEWESPWGIGFPGWHIECSAMSKKYLGFPFDIHTGGVDHKPIHHTNEIAQNKTIYEKQAVHYWLHNEFMTIQGERMAKSLKNTFTIEDLEDKNIHPLAFRYFVLGAHYRTPINFTWDALRGASQAYTNLILETRRLSARSLSLGFFRTIKKSFSSVPPHPEWKERFTRAINDDLNTPLAIGALWDLVKDASISPEQKLATFLAYDTVLGLDLKNQTKTPPIHSSVKALAKKRENFRRDKNWGVADNLRDEINKKGYIIEDTDSGYIIFKGL